MAFPGMKNLKNLLEFLILSGFLVPKLHQPAQALIHQLLFSPIFPLTKNRPKPSLHYEFHVLHLSQLTLILAVKFHAFAISITDFHSLVFRYTKADKLSPSLGLFNTICTDFDAFFRETFSSAGTCTGEANSFFLFSDPIKNKERRGTTEMSKN